VGDPLRETVHETLHALDEAAAKVSSGQHCDRCLGHVPPPAGVTARVPMEVIQRIMFLAYRFLILLHPLLFFTICKHWDLRAQPRLIVQ